MKRNVRVLLGWLERRDALNALRGFRLYRGDDDAAVVRLHEDCRARMLARPDYDLPAMDVEPLPAALQARGEAVIENCRSILGTSFEGRLRTVMIDLRSVIGFQKAVTLEGIADRVGAASAGDDEALADICIPLSHGEEQEIQGTVDKDGHGVTITSFNPNLRVGGLQNVGGAGGGMRVMGFSVMFGMPYLFVVEYKGRYYLKDGYHRAFGLYDLGITRVPCLLETGRTFADVHSGGSGFINQEYLLGTHPPMLADFHDPNLTVTVEQQSLRKVVRIRAEEFVVNV